MLLRRSLLFFLIVSAAASGGTTISICYENRAYPPYFTGENQVLEANPGILPELINASITGLGLEVSFKRRPWKRCIAELKVGRVDAIFAAIWSPERDSWGYFPKLSSNQENLALRLLTASYPVFIHRHGNLSWSGSEFTGIHRGISAPLGYIAYKKLAGLNVLVRKTYSPKEGLEAVAEGILDAYIVEGRVGRLLVEKAGLTGVIKTLPEPFLNSHGYLPFSHQFAKQHPGLAEKIWWQIKQRRN